jgi:hypothetical protein
MMNIWRHGLPGYEVGIDSAVFGEAHLEFQDFCKSAAGDFWRPVELCRDRA